MDFSPQQGQALTAIAEWLTTDKQVFYLAGYAGTGKTTIAKHVETKGEILYAAFTGKAAMVMRGKGCHGASTIHSLIYTPIEKRPGVFEYVLDEGSRVRDAALVIIDEVSMVGDALGKDLLSFGTKVLVIGDPAQLPPIDSAGYFTRNQPNFLLTEVHRQAQDNPIIRMSMEIREGGFLVEGQYGQSKVISWEDLDPEEPLQCDQLLVGMNKTRHAYNYRLRELHGYIKPDLLGIYRVSPQPGEKLVCLKNRRPKGLLNGSMWEIVEVKPVQRGPVWGWDMIVKPLDEGMGDLNREVWVPDHFFLGTEEELDWETTRKWCEEFTYGYALTVHKSQGSQWNHVLLFDESAAFRDMHRRHLYTGITRAAERITIVRGSNGSNTR